MSKMFSNEEATWLVATTVILGFILSFNKWGTTTFDAAEGLKNLIFAIIIVAFSLFIKVSIQKYVAPKWGFHAEYKPWLIGLLLGILLIFLTNGIFMFLAVGGLFFHFVPHLRIGYKARGPPLITIGWLSALGPIVNIFIAMAAKILSAIIAPEFFSQVVGINLLLALYGILPIPFFNRIKDFSGSEGLMLFAASRMAYVGVLLFIVLNIFALSILSVGLAILASIILTVVGWAAYYILIEQLL